MNRQQLRIEHLDWIKADNLPLAFNRLQVNDHVEGTAHVGGVDLVGNLQYPVCLQRCFLIGVFFVPNLDLADDVEAVRECCKVLRQFVVVREGLVEGSHRAGCIGACQG